MRITFVSGCLECGGAERALVLLTESLQSRGHNITVVTLSGSNTDFYTLPEGVNRIALDLIPAFRSPSVWSRLRANGRRVRALRCTLLRTRPDVIVSSVHHINVLTLLATMRTSLPLIVVEHNDPAGLSLGKVWDLLRRLTYARAARLVSVSRGIDKYFDWIRKTQRAVIHNPIVPCTETENELQWWKDVNEGWKCVVAVGRLDHVKGFDLLLPAFASVAGKHRDWRLVIIGEGELRGELETQREQLGLNGRVVMPGRVTDPFSSLRRAQLFVLPSRTEGFPTVLIEAMACGLPVIAANCPSGPREILRDGENGLLVPAEDVAALAAALDRLMSHDAERANLSNKGYEVQERFGIARVTDTWERLLAQVTAEHAAAITDRTAGAN